jgi:hypothetical protein
LYGKLYGPAGLTLITRLFLHRIILIARFLCIGVGGVRPPPITRPSIYSGCCPHQFYILFNLYTMPPSHRQKSKWVSAPTKRQQYSDEERKALQQWVKEQKKKGDDPTQKQIAQWFYSKYNKTISQTGVSRILGPDYNYLDGEQKLRKDAFKHRTQQWVTLEYALFEW